jgi:aminotransferase
VSGAAFRVPTRLAGAVSRAQLGRMPISRVSARSRTFTESVIREMTRVARQHGAINLAQGFPDFPMPAPMKDAACAAIHGDVNQYAVTWGAPALRLAVAEKYRRWYGLEIDAEAEVTVTCGATEAMAAAFLALVDPGDEVVIFSPFYENYGPDAVLAGAVPVFVPLRPPADGGGAWTIDEDRLRSAMARRPKAVVLNTPHNPTGKVFTRAELDLIAALVQEHDVPWVFTDEIYEHIIYAGHHHAMAAWPGMRARTVTISGLSKTFSCTGWRLGYAVAPLHATKAIRKVHDFLTVGAPAPLQAAGAVGLAFDADYYNHMTEEYRARRELLCGALRGAGFTFSPPDGAYYVVAGYDAHSAEADRPFAEWLTREVGVATVPVSSFLPPEEAAGSRRVRFAFCKRTETLERAAERLGALAGAGRS